MEAPGSSRKRILVVEDEPAISEFCARTLTEEGFEVDIAANGIAAQSLLKQGEYTLCLIDIKMPGMDGKRLYQYIMEKYPEMANGVVFTTGDVIGGDTQRFLEQSRRPCLPKPFTPDELLTMVKENFRRAGK